MSYAIKYLIDGIRVRALRLELQTRRAGGKFYTQEDLARATGYAKRKIVAIENNYGFYDRETVEVLAKVLRVHPDEIVLAKEVHWRVTPDLPTRAERNKIRDAIELDMSDRSSDAADLCGQILEYAQLGVCGPVYAPVQIAFITFLSNAGRNDEAVRECELFLEHADESLTEERLLVFYHLGICKRRLKKFGEATKIFNELRNRKTPALSAATSHQLGVLKIQLAKQEGPERARYLQEAIDHFRDAIRIWEEFRRRGRYVPHRFGFPIRRLGEAYDMQGRTEDALRMVLESVHWLAFQHCSRYVEEAKAEVLRLAAKWAAEKACNHGAFDPTKTPTSI